MEKSEWKGRELIVGQHHLFATGERARRFLFALLILFRESETQRRTNTLSLTRRASACSEASKKRDYWIRASQWDARFLLKGRALVSCFSAFLGRILRDFGNWIVWLSCLFDKAVHSDQEVSEQHLVAAVSKKSPNFTSSHRIWLFGFLFWMP